MAIACPIAFALVGETPASLASTACPINVPPPAATALLTISVAFPPFAAVAMTLPATLLMTAW